MREACIWQGTSVTEEDLKYEWEEKLNLKGSLEPDHVESSTLWVRILGFTLSVIGIHWRVFVEEWRNQIYTCKGSPLAEEKL